MRYVKRLAINRIGPNVSRSVEAFFKGVLVWSYELKTMFDCQFATAPWFRPESGELSHKMKLWCVELAMICLDH